MRRYIERIFFNTFWVKTEGKILQNINFICLGSTGQQIQLSANYFALIQAGKWNLNQYRVDFNPEIDHTGQKKALLRTGLQNVQIMGYLFDGTVLYTTTRIQPDPLEVFVQTATGENIRITIRLVGDVEWTDYHYIQLFNIIIRKCLMFMQFQLVGRNYFDPNAKVSIYILNCNKKRMSLVVVL